MGQSDTRNGNALSAGEEGITSELNVVFNDCNFDDYESEAALSDSDSSDDDALKLNVKLLNPTFSNSIRPGFVVKGIFIGNNVADANYPRQTFENCYFRNSNVRNDIVRIVGTPLDVTNVQNDSLVSVLFYGTAFEENAADYLIHPLNNGTLVIIETEGCVRLLLELQILPIQ